MSLFGKGAGGLSSVFFAVFTSVANGTTNCVHGLNFNPSHDELYRGQ